MMSASLSASSLRSMSSSKSLASFANELAVAQRFAEVASTGAIARSSRRRVRPESVLPGLLFGKAIQAAAEVVEDEPAMMFESVSAASMSSMSSSKSLNSFKRELFASGRLGDLNSSGFEARAYRRRVRAVSSVVQPEPTPTPKPSLGANSSAGASTVSIRPPLAERSPFVKYTPSGSLNLTSVRDRSGKWQSATGPSLFADLEPEEEFRLRSALLLPGMQFTSSTIGAEKGDVLRSLTGEPADEKPSRVEKLLQAFKRS